MGDKNKIKLTADVLICVEGQDADSLGIAPKQNFFDFKSPVWNELRDFFTAAKLF